MTTLDDILKNAQPARLIPIVADSSKEERIVSIFLATLAQTRPFAKEILERCGKRVGKYSALTSYTEVDFPSSDGSNKYRPDGVLCLATSKVRWTAIVEAKVEKADIDEMQMERYAEIAQKHQMDAVITLSNQMVSLPTHIPYSIPKKFTKNVQFFHFSWASILTQAQLILRSSEDINAEQAFVLGEMARYFDHPSSGVRRFKEMNAEWRELVLGIQNKQQYKWSSTEIERTVASWHQEERDLSLKLSQRIGQQVKIGSLSRKHKAEPALRFREACEELVRSKELRSSFGVPNAASDLDVVADLQSRTISCSMRLNAPLDKKRASARINWLRRQLRDVDTENIVVRAFWRGRAMQTQASLAEVKEDGKSLDNANAGKPPTGFEIAMIRDVAGRFSRRRVFIEDLEKLVPEFYDEVGQHLRPWVATPPSIDKEEPTEPPESSENKLLHRDNEASPLERDNPEGSLAESNDLSLSSPGDS